MLNLRNHAVSGARWTGASQAAAFILQMLQLAALARLLPAEDFGLMSMIAVVCGFGQSFSDAGLSKALIQRRHLPPRTLSTLYWTGLFAGGVLFAFVILGAPLVARFYGEVRLQGPLTLAAFGFFLLPAGQPFIALLQKELRFRALALAEVSGTLTAAVCAVALAWRGFGVYALVWGQLAGYGVRSLFAIVAGGQSWFPRFEFHLGDLRDLRRFGAFQMGERSVNFLSANLDYLLIGRILGPEALGIYTLAYRLVVFPVQRINPVLTRVAFPLFALRQDREDLLCRGYIALQKVLALVSFPLLMGLAATAPVLIPLVFGQKWLPAANLVPALVLLGLCKTLLNPSGSLLLAKNRADLGFYWNLASALLNLVLFLLALQQGLMLMVWAHGLVYLFYFFGMTVLLHRLVGLSPRAWLGALMAPAGAALGMALCVGAAVRLAKPLGWHPSTLLGGGIALGAAVYLMGLFWMDREGLRELIRLVFKERKGGACRV